MQLSARKGLITVRAGKGGRYREIPVHAGLREHLALWISDERPGGPALTPARHCCSTAAAAACRLAAPTTSCWPSPPKPASIPASAATYCATPWAPGRFPRRLRPRPGRRAHGTRPDRNHPRLQPAHRRRRPGRHQQPPRRPLTSGSACLLPDSGVLRPARRRGINGAQFASRAVCSARLARQRPGDAQVGNPLAGSRPPAARHALPGQPGPSALPGRVQVLCPGGEAPANAALKASPALGGDDMKAEAGLGPRLTSDSEPFINLAGVEKTYRMGRLDYPALRGVDLDDRGRRAGRGRRPVGQRQDDDPQPDQRASTGRRRGR